MSSFKNRIHLHQCERSLVKSFNNKEKLPFISSIIFGVADEAPFHDIKKEN